MSAQTLTITEATELVEQALIALNTSFENAKSVAKVLVRAEIDRQKGHGLSRGMTIDQAGDALIEMIRRSANGHHTAAEALGHREFSLTKLYRSA